LKILVTGASGFIGSQLVPLLVSHGHEVVAASRAPVDFAGAAWRLSPELGPESDWSQAVEGAEAVVHLAGRSLIGRESAEEEQLCQGTNVDGTARLARQAVASGVRHFLFLSSVHAVAAECDEVITAQTEPAPSSAYGRSKLAAEKALRQELDGTACAWTILRPPAVYGSGHASNFGQLAKLATSGIPLPLASVRNTRSFVYVGNLIDVIASCLREEKTFGKIYFPSDTKDMSTPELIRVMARTNTGVEQAEGLTTRSASRSGAETDCTATNRYRSEMSGKQKDNVISDEWRVVSSARLFPFPVSILKAAGRLPGLGALRKLTASLYVHSGPMCRDLGWKPPFAMEEGIRRTLAHASLSPG
jgi:nucleoside-diphosphate-sugar epimerase